LKIGVRHTRLVSRQGAGGDMSAALAGGEKNSQKSRKNGEGKTS